MSAILQFLALHPTVAWAQRMNTGAADFEDAAGDTRTVRFGFTGCSDIIGQLKDGRFLAIEVKSRDGKLTSHQATFLELVRRHHGVAGMARSVDDANKLLTLALPLRAL